MNERLPRIDWKKTSPAAYRALIALETHVRKSGLDRGLLNLVYLRVSQINGCAFCIDMHAKDLVAAGDSAERLALLSVHREAEHLFTARERAALGWAEAVTTLGHGRADDTAAFEAAKAELGEEALVELTLAIATINAWNRLAISLRAVPGAYRAEAK